jgi:hypothetical protein
MRLSSESNDDFRINCAGCSVARFVWAWQSHAFIKRTAVMTGTKQRQVASGVDMAGPLSERNCPVLYRLDIA